MSRLLCCFLLLLCISACSQPQDEIIRFGLASAPANLDPRYATDASSARINRLLYQRLVDFDEKIRPVPALATWEQLAPLHYRFHLQADRAAFHDGTVLEAADVEATYQSILAPDSGSPHAGTLQLIRDISILDKDTLEVSRAISPLENTIQPGDDFRKGEIVFRKGHVLRPQDLGLLAGLGQAEVSLYPKPRVAIISTGEKALYANIILKKGVI